jgi:hypothetical protein
MKRGATLFVARELIGRLAFEQLRLADQKRDQPRALTAQLVVNITQPLERMRGQPLRLVAQQDDHVAAPQQLSKNE